MAQPQSIGAAAAPAVAMAAVARACDGAVLAQYAERSTSAPELRLFEEALARLMQKAAKLPAYPGWRDRMAAGEGLGDGQVFVLADARALCVAAVAIRGQGYPERMAHGALQELLGQVHEAVSNEQLSETKAGKLNATLRASLKEVSRSYSDPAKLDKVTEVHEKVERVKGLMQDNVKKILETHVTLDTLHAQSSSMSSSANQFLKQSSAVKRQLEWRNLRVKLLMGGCALAAGIYLLVTVID